MGASGATRGYLMQAMVCLFESLQPGNDWISVTLEPRDDLSEKIDFLWHHPDNRRAVQVKSSQNVIDKGDVIKWSKELEGSKQAELYELILVGPYTQGVVDLKHRSGCVSIPEPHSIRFDALIDRCAHKLDIYLDSKGIRQVRPRFREVLILALTTQFEIYATTNHTLTRRDLEDLLQRWVVNTYPRAIEEVAEEIDNFAKELEEMKRFRELFGVDAAPKMRRAVWNLYNHQDAGDKVLPSTIKGAWGYLTLDENADDELPKVIYPFTDLAGNVFGAIGALTFFAFAIMTFYLPGTSPRHVIITTLGSLLFASCGLYMSSFVRPLFQAWRISKALQRIKERSLRVREA